MVPGIDPRVDYAFKKLFGSEANVPVLADLLHAVLKPARRIVELQLLNPFNEKDAADDKLSILDIKARDEIGQHYNVEMQLFGSQVHLQRILYYWSVLHAEQLRAGDDYSKLRTTISIAIVNTVLFPEVSDYHLDFQLRSPRHPQVIFSSQQSIHLLELPKFQKVAEELNDPLDIWCYFLTHGVELDAAELPAALQTPMVKQAMEVLDMLSQSDLERQRYQARLKWERDQKAFVDEARELGMKEGMKEGIKEGMKEGMKEGLKEGLKEGMKEGAEKGECIGRIHLCEKMLKLPTTPKEQLAAMSIDELRQKANALEGRLGIGQE